MQEIGWKLDSLLIQYLVAQPDSGEDNPQY